MQNLPTKRKHIAMLTNAVLNVDTSSLLRKWESIYEWCNNHHGKIYTTQYLKSLYVQGVQYALYQEISPIPFRKSDKDGIVKDLSIFKGYLRGTDDETRAALTVLRLYESIYLKPNRVLSTVIDEQTKRNARSVREFKNFVNDNLSLPKIKLVKQDFHPSMKKGPGNTPALKEWRANWASLPTDIRESIKYINSRLGENIERYNLLDDEVYDEETLSPHSRIQTFAAPGGKTRIIAIYDYWSQHTLLPLHHAIFQNLKKIKTDSTYGHESAAEWLKKQTHKYIDSFDLTAATDRIPLELHRITLEASLYKHQRDLVPHIMKVMCDRDFSLSWDLTRTVRYNTGQPMGAYGSWALLAYTHHCIAQFCGCKAYRIIGDDIVICSDTKKERDKYLKFMTSNGIEISKGKSITKGDKIEFTVGEIAKRLIRGKVEITPPTPNLIGEAYKSPTMFPMLLENLVSRDYLREYSSLEDLLHKWYSTSWRNRVVKYLTFPVNLLKDAQSIKLRALIDKMDDPWSDLNKERYMFKYIELVLVKIIDISNQYLRLLYTIGYREGAAPPTIRRDLMDLSPEVCVMKKRLSQLVILQEKLKILLQSMGSTRDADLYTDVIQVYNEISLYVPDVELRHSPKRRHMATLHQTNVDKVYRYMTKKDEVENKAIVKEEFVEEQKPQVPGLPPIPSQFLF